MPGLMLQGALLGLGATFRIKRVQRLLNGAVVVKSDNPAYASETLSPDEAACAEHADAVEAGAGGLLVGARDGAAPADLPVPSHADDIERRHRLIADQ